MSAAAAVTGMLRRGRRAMRRLALSRVIDRVNRLKHLTVDVNAGLAVRHYKVVKSDRPEISSFSRPRLVLPCETITFCRGTSSRPRANSTDFKQEVTFANVVRFPVARLDEMHPAGLV